MNCTGRNCPIQADKVNPATCESHKDCPWVTKSITNAGRIRAMSDEELAEWLTMVERRVIEITLSKPFNYTDKQLKVDWLDWLRKEAEDEG